MLDSINPSIWSLHSKFALPELICLSETDTGSRQLGIDLFGWVPPKASFSSRVVDVMLCILFWSQPPNVGVVPFTNHDHNQPAKSSRIPMIVPATSSTSFPASLAEKSHFKRTDDYSANFSIGRTRRRRRRLYPLSAPRVGFKCRFDVSNKHRQNIVFWCLLLGHLALTLGIVNEHPRRRTTRRSDIRDTIYSLWLKYFFPFLLSI